MSISQILNNIRTNHAAGVGTDRDLSLRGAISKYNCLIMLLLFSNISFAQYDVGDEYNYFSLSAGFAHNFVSYVPDNMQIQSITINGIEETLNSDTNRYSKYGLGYTAGLNFHQDFRNEKTGLVFGAFYSVIPQSYSCTKQSDDKPVTSKSFIHAPNAEVSLKLGGKKLYEQMRYIQIGGIYAYQFLQTQRFFLADELIAKSKSTISNHRFGGFLALNYMFFNLKILYFPKSKTAPQVWYFATSFHLPVNSWTWRPPYDIDQTIRRWFK